MNKTTQTLACMLAAFALCGAALAESGPAVRAQRDQARANAEQKQRYDDAVHEAGAAYNDQLEECKKIARREHDTSQRGLKACQREARAVFKHEMKLARDQLRKPA